MKKAKKRQPKLKANFVGWGNYKKDKTQQQIHRDNARFIAEVNLSYAKK